MHQLNDSFFFSGIPVSHMSPAEQASMARVIDQKQMKDFMKLYTNLVERCFESCCNDFTSRALTNKEDTCIENCTTKFLKHSERVGARFAEENGESGMIGAIKSMMANKMYSQRN